MLNAVQVRMVEEGMVEREVYDARVALRRDIGALVGPAGTGSRSGGGGSGSRSAVVDGYGDLDDLPVGRPPAWHPAAGKPVPGAGGRGPARPAAADGVPSDAVVPVEVMALGDPMRDHQRPVAPFQPETLPRDPGNPFPQLGAKGRPLG